jgi:hypothetical protein
MKLKSYSNAKTSLKRSKKHGHLIKGALRKRRLNQKVRHGFAPVVVKFIHG